MGISNWLQRTITNVRVHGFTGVADSGYELYTGAWRYLGWHVPRGVNVFEKDWDALIILDACRVDLMREVAPEYEFVDRVNAIESVGSMSEEWLTKTFTDKYRHETSETAYVTTNVFSDEVLESDRFQLLDELWRYCWDDEMGTVPPSKVTDRAVNVARTLDPEYLVVHYMQPHHPFVGSDLFGEYGINPFGRGTEMSIVDALRRGQVRYDEFWAAYRDTLRYVLDDVAVLLSNIDAETVVISSDHGEALGEWGVFGHPAGCLHPSVTNVPWIETTANDSGEYEPEIHAPSESKEDVDVERRLRDLGYL